MLRNSEVLLYAFGLQRLCYAIKGVFAFMNLFFALTSSTALALVGSASVLAQVTVPTSIISPTGNPTVVAPSATSLRSTENLSLTVGSRTSLSVGNSTSFGASANLSASEGLTAISRSVLIPASVVIESTIGSNPGSLGKTSINISNLTAKGGGTITPGSGSGASGSTINATDSQFASGVATIDGMGANVKMNIGSITSATPSSTDSQASFFATVHPNVLKGSAACSPTNGISCTYNENGLVSGNAGANANLSTTTNIDIQANSFVQTFAQGF